MDISECVKYVQYGNVEDTRAFLERHCVSADLVDEQGCSLLHWAALNQRYPVVELLLERGANVNRSGGELGETALQWGVRSQYVPVVDLLLHAGTDLSQKSVYGYDALHLACHAQNSGMVCLLLLGGADPNSKNAQGETPLLWAAKQRDNLISIDVIRLLLKFGASVGALEAAGERGNVLHIMASKPNDEVDLYLSLLFCQQCDGARGESALTSRDANGLTPYKVRSLDMASTACEVNASLCELWFVRLRSRNAITR